jgi:hypothetical protein
VDLPGLLGREAQGDCGRVQPAEGSDDGSVITTVVTTMTLRKLRTRTCSRSDADAAARIAVTILPRSIPTIASRFFVSASP